MDKFAKRVSSLKASTIREIFKVLGDKEMISFAGGVPAPELYPARELSEISRDILLNNPVGALQYGITEGYYPLREVTSARMRATGALGGDSLIITSGAQQAIDLTAKVLVNDGDIVACEEPSFIGGLNSFRSYNARLAGIPMEEDGMDLDRLESLLKRERIKLVYTIPNFQNPTGITMSLEKRGHLLSLAKKYDFYILEDNPYGELRFSGEDVPSIKSLDDSGRVIYCGSYSKILSPGLRLGWCIAPEDILEKIVVVKQVNDVHTNIFAQMIAYEYLTRFSIEEYIENARQVYGRRCALMLKSMDENFPDYCDYTRPRGGIFLWCTLPEGADSSALFKSAVQRKVAFVPGNACMVDADSPSRHFRLNYSTASDEKIVEGIKRLAEVIKGG